VEVRISEQAIKYDNANGSAVRISRLVWRGTLLPGAEQEAT